MTSTVPPSPAGEIHFGSTVSFVDQRTGAHETFQIVEPHDSCPAEGRLSGESPVGRALLGRRVHDLVEVHIPRGVRPLLIAAIA
jgi:transcription elongation factor GreA